METVVVTEGSDKRRFDDRELENSPYSTSQREQIADQVVYKLVRVEGDGRLVPATDDEIMEVVDLLKDEKSDMDIVDTCKGCCENVKIEEEKIDLRLQVQLLKDPDDQFLVMDEIELQYKGTTIKDPDSSEDIPNGNIATVPTSKGGVRRKHHRAWTLSEVIKLVEGVSTYGVGRWSEIKRLSFASYSYRTSVDLKDKWRNLLKAASFSSSPTDLMNSRKHAVTPVPGPILSRIRELADRNGQTLSLNF